MGESGCGKSTIAAVLTGRVSGYTGHVTIGGQELSAVSEASLLKNVTLVSLVSHLFKGTVADNLRMAAPGADDGALWGALEQVNLADFLRSMDGLDTPLTEGGGNLSGGQRQRVAAARAMILRPQIILADEPTGALDSRNAKNIMEKLSGLNREGQATILMVTHDSNAASFCRRILFIQDGVIFHELRRGDETQQDFYKRILKVMAQLGGGGCNVL